MEWTKDDDRNTLAYDDTASLFYGAAILFCILIPWTVHFFMQFIRPNALKEALRGPVTAESFCQRKQCGCSQCAEKITRQRRDARMLKNMLTMSNAIQLGVLFVLWTVLIRLCLSIMSVESLDVGAFKPFDILGIVETATPKEIKKAYRTLSLQYHPDRNPDDIEAQTIFMRVSKAYTALTDPTARKNFEKFGNPDGPGNMKVGLGLPRWVVQEDNQIFVLVLFFVVVLIIVPTVFFAYHQRLSKFTASGVRVETLQFLSFYMHEGTRAKLAPEFLAASAEVRDIAIRDSDEDALARVEKEIKALNYRLILMMPSVTKNYYLILCHMMRKHHLLNDNLKSDLDLILRSSPLVTQSMLELAFVNNWLQTVQSVLEFRRSLLQAQLPDVQFDAQIPGTVISLLQIPNLRKEQAQAIYLCSLKNPESKQAIRTLRELVRTSNYRKVLQEALVGDLAPTAAEMNDMVNFVEHVPDIDIKAEITVNGEDVIVLGDLATCKVELERLNLKRQWKSSGLPLEKVAAGAVHCPYFPGTKFEEWFIFLSDKKTGRIVGYKRVQSTTTDVEVALTYRVEIPREELEKHKGEKITTELVVFAMCDSYSGLDTFATVSIEVTPEEAIQREIFIHPEDAALDDEQNLVQSFMGDIIVESDDSESEEFDMDERAR